MMLSLGNRRSGGNGIRMVNRVALVFDVVST